ncbi:hypothetical protein MBRA1_003589 [Malassezia brasiliensis]|uniref:histone acetyltransferase n=1 Tax=Malassezia brasiliensis TaxID=1821822 RepID=A0AAF0DWQ2_9BASI|nr:hypothetical protein MBRA1_003589 [Malassezia brasiliensis]
MAPRDSLLGACTAALHRAFPLQEAGRVRIQTSFSRPYPVRSLYPLAHIHPTDGHASRASDAFAVYKEHVVVTATWTPTGGEERMMYAIECYVYTLPACGAGLFYVAKLDSTGYGPRVVPQRTHLPATYRDAPSIATALTAATVTYFASRAHWRHLPHITHVSVHVLARAQAAYLFPSSPDNPGKRALSDAALIRWWRACLSEAIAQLRKTHPTDHVHAYYMIPGYAKLDSHPLVPLVPTEAPSAPTGRDAAVYAAGWVYGHPYSAAGAESAVRPALPLHPCDDEQRTVHTNDAQRRVSLATLIPVFPDDPKGRFINELCSSAHEPGKRAAGDVTGVSAAHRDAMIERQALDRMDVDRFWESMGFRQECSSGNAVGVFVVSVSGCPEGKGMETTSEAEVTDEARAAPEPTAELAAEPAAEPASHRAAPAPQPGSLPQSTLEDLVIKYMLQDACRWGDATEAVRLTEHYLVALDRATRRKTSESEGVDTEHQLWDTVDLEATPAEVIALGKRHADAHGPSDARADAPVRVV